VGFAAKILLLAAVLCVPAAVLEAGVEGTAHDMTLQTEDIFGGPCQYCHVPHKAKGEHLWVTAPFGPQSGWGSRPIAQLCYSCHDNTGGGYNGADVVMTAYSDFSHGFQVANAPPGPDGSPAEFPPGTETAAGLLDCTSCHDPHSRTPPFLRDTDIDSLCKSCHGRENPGSLAGGNVFGAAESSYSLHPTDVDFSDLGVNGLTNLENFPARLEQPTASGSWQLGAHRVGWGVGTGAFSCQTCHPVHGGWNYLIEVLPGPPASSLTPIENQGGSEAALCQACHQGGDAGELVGEDSDHPINTNDGDPETVFPAGWPAGAQNEVTCSSCHDAHGGLSGTSLLRQGGDAEDGWCFSCHGVSSLTPPYHHSSREIDDPAIFTSVLTCGDCHGRGVGWTAHNGFEGFKVQVLPDSSELCEACHLPDDPVVLSEAEYTAWTGQLISFSGAVYPAPHGRVAGTDSHPVNDIDDDSIENCQVKTTEWAASGGFSKYGPDLELLCESCHGILANAGLVLGDEEEARRTGGWRTNLLLEPYEDNSPGIGVESPDFVAGPTLSGLCRGCHYSVKENVDPTFVHNPPIHTVVDFLYEEGLAPYGRETLELITRPFDPQDGACPEVSSADQMAPPSGLGVPLVPGVYSYPLENRLDCDSCHRPHGADTDSADDGVHRLLEHTEPGRHGTVPCLECHDTEAQCGFDTTREP